MTTAEAIKAVKEVTGMSLPWNDRHYEALQMAIKALEERKTGRWIDIDSETYTWKIRCDKCGNERSMMSTQGRYPKFCEGCGAKMEVEHD